MHVVAIAAPKGGVGKTTTAVQVAAAIARQGLRCLVVDLDPHLWATRLLVGDSEERKGSAEVILEGAAVADVAIETPLGFDLCPSSPALARAELALVSELGREKLLKKALQGVPRGRWAVCLIDCPPHVGLLTANALVAAGAVLTPVIPAFMPVKAVQEWEGTIARVRARLNPRLRPLGYLLCAVDARERWGEDAREQIGAYVGSALWSLEVRIDARLKGRAPGLKATGRAIEDYTAIAAELLHRVGITTVQTTAKTAVKETEL